ncbi:MAG: zeta toxin family protein [Acidobacteriota bacterium]|nr:MAG: zeta toxin family protein [Acidobacteriota bacterium]
MPNVVIIAGPNGAGKSTLAPHLLRDTLNITEFVNADTIAEGLSAFAPERAAFDAGRVMLKRLDDLGSSGQDFAFETTLATRSYIKRIRDLIESGYRVNLIFLWLKSPELAIERVAERVRTGGHYIPTEVIRRRYERGLSNLFTFYMPAVSAWSVRDTNLAGSVEIARYNEKEGESIIDQEKWKIIKQ